MKLLIQEAISQLVKDKTVLIIAHRLRSVESCDRIIVLNEGQVYESGTHEELMKKNGLYRHMLELQKESAGWSMNHIRRIFTMNNSNKLQAKDLVNVGIYSAIYLVITCVLAFLSLDTNFSSIACCNMSDCRRYPIYAFLTKTKKFGMITIMGIVMGIVMLLTGMGYFCLFTGPISAAIADLVAKSGKYISAKKSVLTCGIFSLWYIGNYLAVFITREAQYQHAIDGYGQAYADAYIAIYQYWMLPVLIVACFVSGLIGGVLGKKYLKSIFKKLVLCNGVGSIKQSNRT